MRPLDDPALDQVLARIDKKRHKGGQKSDVEKKVRLVVPYTRREEAKKLGARWSPADRVWWLPADNTIAITEARKLGFVP